MLQRIGQPLDGRVRQTQATDVGIGQAIRTARQQDPISRLVPSGQACREASDERLAPRRRDLVGAVEDQHGAAALDAGPGHGPLEAARLAILEPRVQRALEQVRGHVTARRQGLVEIAQSDEDRQLAS